MFNFVFCRIWVAVQQVGGCQNYTGGAVSALESVLLKECLLQWGEAIFRDAFDGGDLLSVYFDGKDQAAAHVFAIEQDGAGTTVAAVAAAFGTFHTELVAEHFEQNVGVVNVDVAGFAVEGK